MKAISPKEALKSNSERIEKDVEFIVDSMNEFLKSNYNGKKIAINARTLGSTAAIRDAVEKRFRSAGWCIDYQSDQRDGDFYWFS